MPHRYRQARIDWALGSEHRNLSLLGTAALKGTGNTLANVIIGNAGANRARRRCGRRHDEWRRRRRHLCVDNAGDVVIEIAGAGIGTIETRLTWTLGAEIENLTLTGTGNVNASGNSLDNVLTGTSGANRLDGAAGNDTMIGGAGNDTYVVDSTGDVVVEAAAQGTDTVLARVSYALSAEVENLTLTGTAAIDSTGSAGANAILGNAGNNRLDGGLGADSMTGGLGDDTYVVDDALDKTVEAAAGGIDTVESSISWTLAAQLENLALTGTAAINATGNTAGNFLTGNAAANLLNGGTGADTMAGGAGDDVYIVDNALDVVIEAPGAGIDVVQSAVTWTLGNDVENLVLTGTKAISATGNALDNGIVGNGANQPDPRRCGRRSTRWRRRRRHARGRPRQRHICPGSRIRRRAGAGKRCNRRQHRRVELSLGNRQRPDLVPPRRQRPAGEHHRHERQGAGAELVPRQSVPRRGVQDFRRQIVARLQGAKPGIRRMAAFAPPAVGQTTLSTSYATLVPVITANWEEPVAMAGMPDDVQPASLMIAELAVAGPSEAPIHALLEDLTPSRLGRPSDTSV